MTSYYRFELYGVRDAKGVSRPAARCGEHSVTSHAPIGKLARKLVREGFDPKTPVRIDSAGAIVFKNDLPLIKWAEKMYSEGEIGIRVEDFPKEEWIDGHTGPRESSNEKNQ